jgi:RNA polymerase sigma factor (sigma-70 family)
LTGLPCFLDNPVTSFPGAVRARPSGERDAVMARFDTTNWSVVLKAGSGDTTGCQEALARLCETYWYPVYAFVRRRDAEDLTQEYFARFLEKRFLDDVRPERGRFRSFLLVSVRNFLHNERDRARALKRGGGERPVPLHGEDGEIRYGLEPADAVTPEVLFERAWVRAVLDRALERLQAQSEGELQADRFARLRPLLTGDGPDATYAEIAREWGVGEPAVRVAVHRLRRRFGAALREEVGRTVEDPRDVEEEIRHLLAVAGS